MKKKLLIIKKFGGTSLSNIEKIKKVSKLVKKEIVLGNEKKDVLKFTENKKIYFIFFYIEKLCIYNFSFFPRPSAGISDHSKPPVQKTTGPLKIPPKPPVVFNTE